MKFIIRIAISALVFTAQIGLIASANAQVCATPGNDGVTFSRNTYFPGVGTAAQGATAANIGTARADADAATTPFSVGDLALVIQMQDALVDNSNTGAYGNGVSGDPARGATNLRSAGLYEFKRITAVGVGNVTFDSGLANTYVTANADGTTGNRRFQVLRVPQFASVSLPAGTIAVPTWNGDTGGLIALDSSGNLNLNGATIDASGKGFRGGGSQNQAITSGANVLDYAVAAGTGTPPNTLGAAKGEGIAGTPRFVRSTTIVSGFTGQDLGVSGYQSALDYARGAPGNAGGGGNQHNAGGGGGANAGDGGIGGRSFGFYSATNTGPTCVTLTASFFSCAGDGSRAVGGFGGQGITPTASRLFLGGGGGAGETNNALEDNPTAAQGSGGNGGGLVFIRARSISGNATINANGTNGQSGGRDAGGGGGAGGTVVMVTDSTAVTGLVVNTAGGAGGNTGLPLRGAETQGTGGGGGGGAFIKSSGLATTGATSVGGGAAGLNEPVTGISNSLDAAAGLGGVANVNFSGSQFPNPSSCYPQLTVAKSTSTPLRLLPASTTAQYTVSITNAPGVGAAVGVAITDILPVPFTLAGTPAVTTYSGGSLGPNPAPATGTSTALIGTAGSTTATSFFIPPNGVVTVTFLVNLNGAPTGLYQNSITTSYSDPTRIVANGTVSPGGVYNQGGVVLGSNYNASSSAQEDVRLLGSVDLQITKTNGVSLPTLLIAGGTTAYTITVANLGAFPANGGLLTDPVAQGLRCTAVTCTSFGTASCPAAAGVTISALQGSGIPVNLPPATGSPPNNRLEFKVTCGVVATGQ